jgi:1-phosphofructokinase family hexose kinase
MAIHVVQANPAMDRIEVLEGLKLGSVNRSIAAAVVAGGKGLNVARGLRRLGHPVAAYGFLGGTAGEFIRQACARLGIADRHVSLDDETRICMILVDSTTGRSTVINERGPTIGHEDEVRLIRSVVACCRSGDVVVMAGSLPAGASADLYARLVSEVAAIGARAVVDTSGGALRAAMEREPWMVKANVHELAEVGLSVDRLADHVHGGTEWIVATDGEGGAEARSKEAGWRATVPTVDVTNATGAGDVLLAGLLDRLERGAPMAEALRFAAACAAASVTSIEPELPDGATIARVLDATHVAEA